MADHTNTVDYRSPVYLQMRELIRSRIAEGIYQPGGSIPSENELAAEFEINRLTVRSAVDILVKEGLLKRVQGKGVYVTGGKIEQDVGELKGFTSTLQESRRKSGKKILARKVRPAGIKYASIFGIDPGDPVYYIRRLCSADGEPVFLEEIYIPQAAAGRRGPVGVQPQGGVPAVERGAEKRFPDPGYHQDRYPGGPDSGHGGQPERVSGAVYQHQQPGSGGGIREMLYQGR